MFAALLLSLIRPATSTPSVWSCPFVNPYGAMAGMDFRMGEECPASSFLHYYSCCDDNPFQCCFHFETYVIILSAIVVFFVLGGVLFLSGRLLMNSGEE